MVAAPDPEEVPEATSLAVGQEAPVLPRAVTKQAARVAALVASSMIALVPSFHWRRAS